MSTGILEFNRNTLHVFVSIRINNTVTIIITCYRKFGYKHINRNQNQKVRYRSTIVGGLNSNFELTKKKTSFALLRCAN